MIVFKKNISNGYFMVQPFMGLNMAAHKSQLVLIEGDKTLRVKTLQDMQLFVYEERSDPA